MRGCSFSGKRPLKKSANPDGTQMSSSASQPSKANSLIDVTEPGMTTLFNWEQPWNKPRFISVMEFGISILVRLEQLAKV